MTTVPHGPLIHSGKTKSVFEHPSDPSLALIGVTDDITKFDDPDQTGQFATKGVCSTTTICRNFELLRLAGVPVAYTEQLSPTEYGAQRCEMIRLEAVARRFAVGSMLKRAPHLATSEGEPPHRFDSLVTELFLKTTGGEFRSLDDRLLITGLDPAKGEEDPLIEDPDAPLWELLHPKLPPDNEGSKLGWRVHPEDVLPKGVSARHLSDILTTVFTTLENAWGSLKFRLVDLKIEFGIDTEGRLRVADGISADEWRLRTWDWSGELSKQLFRDGDSMAKVEEVYQTVARLSEQLAT